MANQGKRPLTAEEKAAAEKERVEKKESLFEHLRAMRRMLVVSVAAVAVVFVVLFYGFCNQLVDFILEPVRSRGIEIIATAVSEALMMQLKSCLIVAIVLAMPVIIQQVWSFVSPALYPSEKRLFMGLFVVMALLFALGVVFCYVVVFPLTVDLFWEASEGVAHAMWSVNEYLNFALSFILPFGLMFEMPVAVFMLARHGKANYRSLCRSRKYVILAIAVVAAVLTPPDVISQCMLMAPMVILYEISVQVSRFVKPKKPVEAE